jgi:hypothetical protein
MVAELERMAGNAPHVAGPEPPVVVYGLAPSLALAEAEDMAERGCDRQGRRVKRDAVIIKSVVASYPKPWPVIKGNPTAEQEYRRWQELTLQFALHEFGQERVASVVLHTDEGRPHLHVLLRSQLVPHRLRDGQEVLLLQIHDVDPLRAASVAVSQGGGGKASARNAGRQAGASLQLRYARAVAPLGLHPGDGRAGPRLPRVEAVIRAEVRARTDALRIELEAYRRRELEYDQAAVAVAAERRARGVLLGDTLTERARRRNLVAETHRTGDYVPKEFVPLRLAEDGSFAWGGLPLQPHEPLRPPRGQSDELERRRGDEAAIEKLKSEIVGLMKSKLAAEAKSDRLKQMSADKEHASSARIAKLEADLREACTALLRSETERERNVEQAQLASSQHAKETQELRTQLREALEAAARAKADAALEALNATSLERTTEVRIQARQAEHKSKIAAEVEAAKASTRAEADAEWGGRMRVIEGFAYRKAEQLKGATEERRNLRTKLDEEVAAKSAAVAERDSGRRELARLRREIARIARSSENGEPTMHTRLSARPPSMSGTGRLAGEAREVIKPLEDLLRLTRGATEISAFEIQVCAVELASRSLVRSVRRAAHLDEYDHAVLDVLIRVRRDAAAALETTGEQGGAEHQLAARIRLALPPRVLLSHVAVDEGGTDEAPPGLASNHRLRVQQKARASAPLGQSTRSGR